MLKRISLILMVLVAIVFLSTGCGSTEKSTTPNRPEPVSIDGKYKTHSTAGPNFNVDIEDGNIVIDVIMDETTSGLYWVGSAPKTAVGTFSSIAEKGALDRSLFGSGADSKDFVADGSKVSFEFQMMGVTTQVEAVR